MPTPYSIHTLRHVLEDQTERVNDAIASNTLDLIHQNKFNSLSRQDQRIVEYYQQRVVTEQSLQKDIAKATTMATRIGDILEQVRTDLTGILTHLTDNTNPCTTGSDVGLTADGSSSEAWIAQLTLLIQNLYHYVEAQQLGDYALLHEPVDGTGACDCVYRSKFYYATPSGDCLAIPSTMGTHFKATTNSPTPPNDAKSASTSLWQWCVSNPNLNVRDYYNLLVGGSDALWTDVLLAAFREAGSDANSEYATAVYLDKLHENGNEGSVFTSTVNRLQSIQTYMEANSGLPQTMIQAFISLLEIEDIDVQFSFIEVSGSNGSDPVYYTFDSVAVLVPAFDPSAVQSLSDLAQYTLENRPSGFNPGAPNASSDIVVVNNAVAEYITTNIGSVLAHAPYVANIEDACDLQYIITTTTNLLSDVNGHVDVNDRERSRMQYINENAAANESFFSDKVQSMTSIDTQEVTQRLATLQECAADLKELKPSVALSKQMLQRSLAGW